MGDHQQSSPYGHHTSEPEDRSERVQEDATLGLQGTVYESWGSRDAKYQDLDDRELGLESQEEEIPPEEVTGEELMDSQHPAEAIAELERVLEKDEEGVPEMSHPVPVSQTGQREGLPCVHLAAPLMGTKVLLSFSGRLSISQRLPSTSAGRERRKRRRLFELAKPKTNWHVLKDRPSVYWTERFLEDTTLTITVPEVSRRVEELARPKRFYSECYSNNRTTSVWPIPRSTLGYQASSRLRELARPKMRSSIWNTSMSEVSQVSRAARMAVPSPRILLLAKPRAPATLLEEWDPMPKPKPHVSDYNRLLHLASSTSFPPTKVACPDRRDFGGGRALWRRKGSHHRRQLAVSPSGVHVRCTETPRHTQPSGALHACRAPLWPVPGRNPPPGEQHQPGREEASHTPLPTETSEEGVRERAD
ncbi:sperm microtubule associated protein 2 isoform X2 [Vicugna pacos]|uniref:Sperm microtubule associated protein 2 isoform X2 n=1 Tax=Vicugna pacos TaxID=30538 RepID=A0ABM5C6J0_VICPA